MKYNYFFFSCLLIFSCNFICMEQNDQEKINELIIKYKNINSATQILQS
jgi:hypothetical protein